MNDRLISFPHAERVEYGMPPLPRRFYDRDVVEVARDLLGTILVSDSPAGRCTGRIVETEAYLASDDPASHSHRGPNRKNATMFREPGLLYVYTIHARFCMNVVTEPHGTASAVLLRAVEPLEGQQLMQSRRGIDKLLDLARGPARLCQAFQVDRQLDGWDLTLGERIWIERPAGAANLPAIAVSPRIGVTSAHDLPLRFFYPDNPFVSGPREDKSSPYLSLVY